MKDRYKTQLGRFAAAGQDHVLGFWNQLDDAQRARLLDQLEAVPLELVAELGSQLKDGAAHAAAPELAPPDIFPIARSSQQEAQARQARERGIELLAAGRVGYVLVAGGQGSRLGLDGPKGMFPVGPISGQTLFEIHAARLEAARERWGAPVSWYVMTSPANHAATQAYFAECDHFGLGEENIFLFQQAMLPALDLTGRVLLADPGNLFLAPNGHGGTLEAMASSGALEHAAGRGIEVFSYFQVDNPLVRPADPLFIGLHAEAGAAMSTKVIPKRDAAEKVGVIGLVDGRFGCIEYSDLSPELLEARDEGGALLYRAGNTAVHVIDLDFIRSLTDGGLSLPWHQAKKRIPTVDRAGARVEVDGVKFETFIFDALAASERSVTLEVDRALEFSPVKNAEGSDSPATTRADLCGLFAGWARECGCVLPDADGAGNLPIEVDPRRAEDLDEFRARLCEGLAESGGEAPGHLYR
ncbi:MAG: UDPGP type 1 family protein [Planctomycetota bacterium]|jgi:UDP-N-acetylglucosamine/UDP-N-acetylgalactosamine diphosphorylase|nr:UDPGP type 1 family protein [Planctomycetota bacterium]